MTPSPDDDPVDLEATIAQMFVYPIKSCAGLALDSAVLTATGLALDRAWMVVDEHGEFVSQRELPRMALLQPTWGADEMVVHATGMAPLSVPLAASGPAVRVRVWDDAVRAFDMGAAAGQWFTEVLSQAHAGGPGDFRRRYGALRLVRFDEQRRRPCSPAWTAGFSEASTLFSDGFPVLVSSVAALEALNQGLAVAGEAAVGMDRFRPNLVLGGVPAHDEDHIAWLNFPGDPGGSRLRLVKPCVRCGIPDIDPTTAQRSSAVTAQLMRSRPDARMQGALTWGMNAIVVGSAPTRLQVGQRVQGRYGFDRLPGHGSD